MVKKLRIRFTLTSALILLFVLAVVGVVINLMNYYNFIASTDKTMSVIAANNGEFPDYEDYLQMLEEERLREEAENRAEEDETDEEDALQEEVDAESFETDDVIETEADTDVETEDEQEEADSLEAALLDKFDYTEGFGFGLKVTAETAYETRYFYVRFTPDAEMIGYDLSHIAEVSREDAEKLGRALLANENDSGVYGNYRFLRHETEGGATEIIFLNCATQLRSVAFVLYISIFTLVLVLAAVTAAVWLMSKKIVKPFVDNLDKQKQFITDAGHEIKTPLSIIDANAEVLKLTTGGNEWIDSIQNQTSRLASLVKKLVSLSKSEEETDEVKFEKFSVSDAAEETVAPFRLLAEKGGVSLDTEIEQGVSMKGHEALIRQLFGILLDNAIKYTPQGGAIKVTLADRGRCVFEVCNDCEELDVSKIPHYFDRFYRADDSRSRETGGYGIGLSIAKAIVEKHKGKISAASRDGKSITFTVTI